MEAWVGRADGGAATCRRARWESGAGAAAGSRGARKGRNHAHADAPEVAATGAVEAASAMLVKTVGREGGKAADVMRTFVARRK